MSGVGRFITRLRRGDVEVQDQVFTEAQRLYEARTPLADAVNRLIEIAGDNPHALNHIRSPKGFHKTPEGRAVIRLIASAYAQRHAADRLGVPLPRARHSAEEQSLAAIPIADAFDLLAREEPRLLDADSSARQLAAEHRDDGDGGAALQEALRQLVVRVVWTDQLVGKTSENGSVLGTQVAAMVVMEHLAASAGVDTSLTGMAAGGWWPQSD